MGITKTSGFTKKQLRKAELFKALGHPARIAIIEYILQSPACICGQIVDKLPLAQSTISKHLKELKSVGIIQGNIEGNQVCYCINDKVWSEIKLIVTS